MCPGPARLRGRHGAVDDALALRGVRHRGPVDLWYGSADTSPVHSPDAGAGLAARIPNARRHVVDGAGGALLWTEAARILAPLLERAQ